MSDTTVQGGTPPGDSGALKAEAQAAPKPAKPAAKEQPLLLIASSPHTGSPVNSHILMRRVLLALAPVTIFGVFIYGYNALFTVLVSILAAELAEALFRKITRQGLRNRDLSAAVTGLLLALVLPPLPPESLWIAAIGAFFAIIVAKEFFGGLGANVFNPALAGRAFLLMSFPVAMMVWAVPGPFFEVTDAARGLVEEAAKGLDVTVEALSGATPLAIIKPDNIGGAVKDVGAGLAAAGLAVDGEYWSTIGSLFLGLRGGCIGESSILLILIGFIFLLATKTIDWRAPLLMIISVFVFSAGLEVLEIILGGTGRDLVITGIAKNALFAVLAGGVFFGAVFMATDYVSAPVTAKGKLIFGFGAGLITVLIRQFGNYPEGVTYGILIMNAAAPFLNRLLQKKYGYVKPQKAGAAGAAKGGAK